MSQDPNISTPDFELFLWGFLKLGKGLKRQRGIRLELDPIGSDETKQAIFSEIETGNWRFELIPTSGVWRLPYWVLAASEPAWSIKAKLCDQEGARWSAIGKARDMERGIAARFNRRTKKVLLNPAEWLVMLLGNGWPFKRQGECGGYPPAYPGNCRPCETMPDYLERRRRENDSWPSVEEYVAFQTARFGPLPCIQASKLLIPFR